MAESLFEVEFWGTTRGYLYDRGPVWSERNNRIYCTGRTALPDSQTLIEKYGYSIATTRATPYFYNLFGAGDLRRDWTIAPFNYDTSTGEKEDVGSNYWIRSCGKFRRELDLSTDRSGNYTSINFPLLRYADVLLMWAEGVAADPSNNNEEVGPGL